MVDLEGFRARRERGSLGFLEAAIDEGAGTVLLNTGAYHFRLSPAAARAIGQRLLELAELAAAERRASE